MKDIAGIVCSCGCTPKRVDCTERELHLYNCGRSYECCIQAWLCLGCKTRWVFSLEAPEME